MSADLRDSVTVRGGWHVLACDRGQTVEVSYASDRECAYYRHTLDRSDRSERLERLAIDDAEGRLDPGAGLAPRGEWQTVAEVRA